MRRVLEADAPGLLTRGLLQQRAQAELARLLDESQANIALCERSERPPRSDVLPALARILACRIEDLIEATGPVAERSPSGKVQELFEQVRTLPRRKQQRVVEALLREYSLKAS